MLNSQEWIPADGLVLEDAAYDAVVARENVLVTAGPGSGKTELLAQKACFLLQSEACRPPHRILAISFKNDSAANLKSRVKQRCGTALSTNFDSLTFDGFCKMVLDKYRYTLPPSCRPSGDYVINDQDRLSRVLGSRRPSEQDSIIRAGKLPLQMNTPQNQKWLELLSGDENGKSCLSFSMVRMLAKYILDTHNVISRLIREVYRFVFIDEYQDTTKWQYDLLSSIVDNRTEVIAVGDNKQRIMLWAGAMRRAFDVFTEDYYPTCKSLLMNHRSAPRLVDLQKLFYSSLGEATLPIQPSQEWNPEDGSIILAIASDAEAEAKFIASRICNLIQNGVNPERICILCKQKVKDYAETLSQHLANYDVRIQYNVGVLELQHDHMVVFLLLTLKHALKACSPEERKVIEDTIDGISDLELSYEKRCTSLRALSQLLNSLNNRISSDSSAASFEECFWEIINMFGEDTFTDFFSSYKPKGALNGKIEYLSSALFEECLLSTDVHGAIDSLLGKGIIPAITIHKSKGLEYDHVFFLGLEDSAFWNFGKQPEEDRCAFFVALSRAKREIVFTFCKKRSEQKQSHQVINEFFEVLSQPGIAEIINV